MSKPTSFAAASLTALLTALPTTLTLVGCGDLEHEAAEAPALGQHRGAMNGAGQYMRVANFGDNPGALNMYFYTPSPAPQGDAPLVLALHGCSQNAGNYRSAGWEPLADEHGFYVLYPEQSASNNSFTCFNWGGEYGEPINTERGDGENQSIVNMIEWASQNHGIDRNRVFITGFSGGGAMTALMLATWPDVFAAGAPIAGIPYLCYDPPGGAEGEASYDPEVRACLSPGKDYTPQQWGDYVRRANPDYNGPLPWVSIWQGNADFTVATRNRVELYEQWSNAHGIDASYQQPSETENVGQVVHKIWNNDAGQGVVEAWEHGGGHTVPMGAECDPGFGGGLYFSNQGICSTLQIARFFGITGEGGGPGGGGEADRTPPTVNITAPSNGESVSGNITVSAEADDNVGVVEVTFKANGDVIGTANGAPWQITWDTGAVANGNYTLSAEAVDANGNRAEDADTQITVSGGVEDDTPPTVSLVTPTEGAELSGFAMLSAEATDDNSVAQVEFFADDASIGVVNMAAGDTFALNWDTSAVAAGAHTLTAVATDAAGNDATSSGVTVTVIAGPSAVATFTNPTDGATLTEDIITVSATIESDTPVRSVVFLYGDAGGQVPLSTDFTAPYEFDWDLRNRDEGPLTLIAQVYADDNGNPLLMGLTEINVTVARDGGAGGSGGEPAGGSTGGSGGDDGAGGEGGAQSDEPRKVGKEYWGCATAGGRGAPALPLLLLGLVALGLRRRR